jgi:MinD-like ATPase involved in chromosome partitioning or flagellar assembly
MRARHLGSPEGARADQERIGGTRVLVTSVLERGVKTTVSAETALGLAVDGHDVVLVDFDLQSPTLHRQFESVEQSHGVWDVLGETIALERAFSKVALHPGGRGGEAPGAPDAKSGSLRVLAAGVTPSTGRGDVSTEAVYDLIDRLGRACDFLIIDAPPVLSGNEVRDLSRLADGLLIVVQETSASTDVQPKQLRFVLASFDAEIVGVVGTEAQAAEVVSIVPARKAALAHGD